MDNLQRRIAAPADLSVLTAGGVPLVAPTVSGYRRCCLKLRLNEVILVIMTLCGYQSPSDLVDVVADLVRLGLAEDSASVRRVARRLLKGTGDYSERLRNLLAPLLEAQDAPGELRRSAREPRLGRELPPVDDSSFFSLVMVDEADEASAPVLAEDVGAVLEQIVAERRAPDALRSAGVDPTRTLLLTGPPGVGKTMAAKYLAGQLGWPLFTVDLAALVSSLLGRTGQNLRQALNFGHRNQSVLFLDEFDALAKRRDDDSDVGELKRIVNVLLQEVDRWPASGLLVAATNHPELLDRAVWRRFERVLDLKVPGVELREQILKRMLATHRQVVDEGDLNLVALATADMSGSDLERLVNEVVRNSLIRGENPFASQLISRSLELLRRGQETQRVAYAGLATSVLKLSQRQVAEQLGVSHVTVGKYVHRWSIQQSAAKEIGVAARKRNRRAHAEPK